MSVLNWEFTSSSIFAPFFILMTHNSPENLKPMHFQLWTKESHKVPILRLSSALAKTSQIPYVVFESKSHFFFKFCNNIQCHQTQLPCTFSDQTLYALVKDSPLKYKFLRFLSAWMKIRQIPHVSFELRIHFLFNFCTILHSHDT